MPEFVDVNHPYMTDHDGDDFQWDFDGEKATAWAAAVVGAAVGHTLQSGAEHAFGHFAVQSGLILEGVEKGTQLPVLMYRDPEDGTLTPVAVLLVPDDKRINVAHTLGTLITEDGTFPALPSQNADEFYSPTFSDEAIAGAEFPPLDGDTGGTDGEG